MALPKLDAFTGSEDTVLSTYNANWVFIAGVGADCIQINGNKACGRTNSGVDCVYRWAGDTFSNDQYAQGVLSGFGFTGKLAGMCVRVSADTGAAADYYAWRVNDDASSGARTTLLVKVVNGSSTTLDTRGIAWVDGDVMRLEVSGTTLTCKRNGTTVFTLTDSSLTAGNAGLLINGGSFVLAIDDWEGGNISAASKLFRSGFGGGMSGVGAGGRFFQNPLQRVMASWKRLNGIFVPINYQSEVVA